MNLNKLNGEITIVNHVITSNYSLNDLRKLGEETTIIQFVDNPPYKYFKAPNLSEYQASTFSFTGQKLSMLSIGVTQKFNFPPYEMSLQEKNQIKAWLKDIGGNGSYNWGEVSYSENLKGRVVSIIIKYF